MADVEAQFKAALDVIQSLPKSGSYKPSPDMMLHFYSLYKQATEGKCNRSKPWSFDIINKAKWDAWSKLGDMSKEEAMKNYVTELTKVMKNFPPPTDDQIIEALPATDKAANFIETLGHFYEIIDPTSENARDLKQYADARKVNGNHHPLSNGGPHDQHTNGTSTPDSEASQHSNSDLTDAKQSSESDENSNSDHDDSIERNEIETAEKNLPPTTDRKVVVALSESDDEFCDTSAEITNPSPRHRDYSGSHSTSTLSSTSFTGSPCRATDKQFSEISLSAVQQPCSRGGEKGTHGIDESMQFDQHTERVSQPMPLSQPNFSPRLEQGPSTSGGGGAGGDRNPSENNRQSEVQERIAVALLQLQRDMHSVLNRLQTLETITIARQQDSQLCPHCCMRGREKKTTWWLFDDLSPRTTLFILIWPFLARLLMAMWTKKRIRHRK